MDHSAVRELTAAYALDALDAEDERAVEEHLGVCEQCREDVAAFTHTAAALAYAVDAPPPPPGLRDRILEAARDERSNVVPLRPRRTPVVASVTVAAAAAVAAIALGAWATSLSRSLDREREAVAVLSDPTAEQRRLAGAEGRLVVSRSGEAALIVAGLPRAPRERTYQVWIVRDGSPVSAGLFDGDDTRDLVMLAQPVRPGETVAVTVEREGGAQRPSRSPLFSARV